MRGWWRALSRGLVERWEEEWRVRNEHLIAVYMYLFRKFHSDFDAVGFLFSSGYVDTPDRSDVFPSPHLCFSKGKPD